MVLIPLFILFASFGAFSQTLSNNLTSISPILDNGRAIGFHISSSGKDVADIFFGSLKNIYANKVEIKENSLIFSDIRSTSTPTFGKNSFISLKLYPNDPYPEISFRLELSDFSPQKWETEIGRVPFHFLVCPIPGAEVFHQRGWLIPTPISDPYPILNAEGPGKHIASNWSNNWTYAPPLGAYPVPVVGLWKPSESKYVGYEFQGTRLTDNSEKDIATAYCWELKDAKQFFTLVYPYAENAYRDLRYPKKGDIIQTHFRLIFSLNLPSDDDPNFFVHHYIWERYGDLLPSAPLNNDFGWLPQQFRLSNFPIPSFGGLYSVIGEGNPFQKPGNIDAWGVDCHTLNPVIDYIYEQKDEKAINKLREDLNFLMQNAEKMRINGEDCVFWRKPIKGDWHDSYGKGVPTVHQPQGWQVALAFLEAYRHEHNPAYLPYIDGALRFTKYILYTRNCYDDVPASQFCWHAAPATTFLLAYYYAFRNDPERASLAQEAYKLALAMLYKNLPIFISDNDKSDDIDASFFMEPNSGFPWLGEACANEVWSVAYALALTYVATGDPIIGHYLRGMVERWPQLFRDEYYPSIKEYDGAFAEMYGLYDGCLVGGKGKRSTFGFLSTGLTYLAYPIGNAEVRVVCGERGALAFNKSSPDTNIADYRYRDSNFSFRIVSTRSSPFDLVITFPYLDLRNKPVFIIRDGKQTQLQAGSDYLTYPQRPDSIYIKNVQNEDVIALGQYDPSAPMISCAIAKPRTPEPPKAEGFQILNLAPHCNYSLPQNWNDPSSFAGLIPGERILYGIPFFLVDPTLNQGKNAVRNSSIPVNQSATYVFLLITNVNQRSSLSLVLQNGERKVNLANRIPVIYGWPPLFEWKIELVREKVDGEIKEIRGENIDVLAITLTNLDDKSLSPIFSLLRGAEKKAEEKRKSEERLANLKLAENLAPLKGHIAILPQPHFSSNIPALLRKAKAMVNIDTPSPQQIIDPSYLNPQRIWVLLYLGGEEYYQNIGGQENGDKAILNYLKDGGLIVFLPSGPYPFYYNENGKPVVSASKFGLYIGNSWESPPNVNLSFQLNKEQKIITSLPAKFPWLKDVDQRWRGAIKPPVAGVKYIPILTLKDSQGRSYGEAIAYIEYTEGELKGARLLYVWCSLLQKDEYLYPILKDVIAFISKQPAPPAKYTIFKAPTPPVIDGDLSDTAWLYAETINDFRQFNLSKPTYATQAKMLWDDENLYIAFKCQDEDIWATMKGRDEPLWEEEVVEVYIDPSGTGRNYKEFEVNPLGALIDLNIPAVKNGNPGNWRENCKWNAEGVKVGVKVNGTIDNRKDKDKEWTVELAIPLKNFLPYKPAIGTEWRVQLFRIDRSNTLKHPEFSSWSPTDTFHNPDRFGKVIFMGSLSEPSFSYEGKLSPIWRPSAGEWRVEDGVLIGKNGIGDGWIGEGIHFGLVDWKDYTFSVEFRIISRGSDWRDCPWFGFRYKDGQNAYSLNFSDKNIQLHKVSEGISTGDENPLISAPWSVDGNWHSLRVSLRGNTIIVNLDGKEIINIRDDNLNATPAIPNGEIVLVPRRWSGSTGDTVVAYRNFKIEVEK